MKKVIQNSKLTRAIETKANEAFEAAMKTAGVPTASYFYDDDLVKLSFDDELLAHISNNLGMALANLVKDEHFPVDTSGVHIEFWTDTKRKGVLIVGTLRSAGDLADAA